MKKLLTVLCLFSAAGIAAARASETVVRFHTTLGDIDVLLDPTDAPMTVANFLTYVNGASGANYTNSFFHRSVPGFVIQGGGYYVANGQVQSIVTHSPVNNEYKVPNTRGTIAMAKTSDPNSATDEWFFNLVDNTTTLGTTNDSGFTVFGTILSSEGLAVMDAIAALQVVNAGSPFDQLPVIDYQSGTVAVSNLVYVTSVTVQPVPEFFSGETVLNNGVYYLAFPSGQYFGYYSYLNDPHYIYHFDLGYEYCFDANDGKDGIYFYDFDSKDFFYTSPTFPFPYLYDFTLKTVLYYYPNPSEAGHYNTNGVRYFYDFATGKTIQR